LGEEFQGRVGEHLQKTPPALPSKSSSQISVKVIHVA